MSRHGFRSVELARSKGVAVTLDAIVPIVDPRNPVKNLSVDQVSRIYQGKIPNRKEVAARTSNGVILNP
ncbi:MAG: hypothetical protein Q8O19_06645 [Rectinemataceae bacterium]|nr:hypothetical protein [Rectinemataceae bacterium]